MDGKAHNAQWIAEDIGCVIDSVNGDVVGVVMDNAAANKKAWKMLENKYPQKFFHGCVSHGLHLLIKDIFSSGKNR